MNKKTRYKYVVSPGALSEASFFNSCESRWLVEIEECPAREEDTQVEGSAEEAEQTSTVGRGMARFKKVLGNLIQYLPAAETGYAP